MRADHLADISLAIAAGTGAATAGTEPGHAFTRALIRALDKRHGRRAVDAAGVAARETMWRWRSGRSSIGAGAMATLLTILEGTHQR